MGCSRDADIAVTRDSLLIAPSGTYTNDWDWRKNIKENDEVSAADDYGNWYRSTIYDIKQAGDEQDIDGNPVYEAKIAFRFLDPYGTKVDDKDNKYTGWNEKEDRVLKLSLPNIQKVHALTFHYNKIVANMKLFDLNEPTDILDIIYPSTEVHQYCVRR